MKENYFGIGKFWAFGFAGLATIIATSCLYIIGYFSVIGMSTVIPDPSVIPTSPTNLLWKISYVEWFLKPMFVIILLTIFENWITYASEKIRELARYPRWTIPAWVTTGVRYSDVVMITMLSFVALYYVCTLVSIAISGSYTMTTGISIGFQDGSPERLWSGLAAIICPMAVVIVTGWIIIAWAIITRYLLQRELRMLETIVIDIIKTIFSNMLEILKTGDSK